MKLAYGSFGVPSLSGFNITYELVVPHLLARDSEGLYGKEMISLVVVGRLPINPFLFRRGRSLTTVSFLPLVLVYTGFLFLEAVLG